LPVNTSLSMEQQHRRVILDYLRIPIKALGPKDFPSAETQLDPKHILIKIGAIEEKTAHQAEPQKKRKEIKNAVTFIDEQFIFANLSKSIPLMVQGEPGSGKSTLFFDLFRLLRQRLDDFEFGWIPVLILANDLSIETVRSSRNMQDLLVRHLEHISARPDFARCKHMAQFIKESFDDYRFLIFIDGLDEFTERSVYTAFADTLNKLVQDQAKYTPLPKDRFIISCRDEDNQGRIVGRLITLQPITQRNIDRHLAKFERFYRRANNHDKASIISNIREGLTASKQQGLLQNYISNPYLLSLITQYYNDKTEPLANTLNDIFKDVLTRELKKAGSDFGDLHSYISSLLAPYCFYGMISGISPRTVNVHPFDFMTCLYTNKDLNDIFLGHDDIKGLLRSIYDKDADREESFSMLVKLWNNIPKALWFVELLVKLRSAHSTWESFHKHGLKVLHEDMVDLLKESNLAEFGPDGVTLKRLRHRRMQEYFTALFLDNDEAGINYSQVLLDNLASAWVREPIRVFAAVSSKPAELLDVFCMHFDSEYKSNQAMSYSALNRLCDLMVNASAAVAYLPSPKKGAEVGEDLLAGVKNLGIRAIALYLKVGESEATLKGQAFNLWEKSLFTLRDIWAAEFWNSEDTSQELAKIFTESNATTEGRWINIWRSIHRLIVKRKPFYQHFCYQSFFPLKQKQDSFPIGHVALFAYVADVVLISHRYYVRFILDTHWNVMQRLPIRFLILIERLTCLVVIFGYVLWIWTSFGWTITGLLAVGVPLLLLVPIAALVQSKGYMEAYQVIHLPFWLLILFTKKLWGLLHARAYSFMISYESHKSTRITTLPLKQSEWSDVRVIPDKDDYRRSESTFFHERISEVKQIVTDKANLRNLRRTVSICLVIILLVVISPKIAHLIGGVYNRYEAHSFSRNATDIDQQASQILDRVQREAESRGSESDLKLLQSGISQIRSLIATLQTKGEAFSYAQDEQIIKRTDIDQIMRSLENSQQKINSASSKINNLIQANQNIERLKNWDMKARALLDRIRTVTAKNSDALSRRELEIAASEILGDKSSCEGLKNEIKSLRQLPVKESMIQNLDKQSSEVSNTCLDLARYEHQISRRLFLTVIPSIKHEVDKMIKSSPALITTEEIESQEETIKKLESEVAEHLENAQKMRNYLEQDGKKDDLQGAVEELTQYQRLIVQIISRLEVRLSEAKKSAMISDYLTKAKSLVDAAKKARSSVPSENQSSLTRYIKDTSKVLAQVQAAIRESSDLGVLIPSGNQKSEFAELLENLQKCSLALQNSVSTADQKLQDCNRQAAITSFRDRADSLISSIEKSDDSCASDSSCRDLLEQTNRLILESRNLLSSFEKLQVLPNERSELLKHIGVLETKTARLEQSHSKIQGVIASMAPEEKKRKQDDAIRHMCEYHESRWNKEIGPKLLPLQNALVSIIQSDWPELKENILLAESPQEWGIFGGVRAQYRISEALRTVDRIEAIAARVPSSQRELLDYIQELKSFLASTETDTKDNVCSGDTSKRLQQLVVIQQKLDEFMELNRSLNPGDLRNTFAMAKERASQKAKEEYTYGLAGLFVLAFISVVLYFWMRIGERKGRRELQDILNKKEYKALLSFIVCNPYSSDLNRIAVDSLRPLIPDPPTPESLEAVSNAARARWARGPGVLNDEVGQQLHQLYKGIENVINRAQPTQLNDAEKDGPSSQN